MAVESVRKAASNERSGKNGNGLAEGADRAVCGRPWEKSGSGRELDMVWRSRRLRVVRWANGSHLGLMDRRRHRGSHDGRVGSRSSARGSKRVGSLAAVASVGKLMIVKAARELSLFQVSSNVLVGHLLKTSLKKIHFLVSISSAPLTISVDLTSSSLQALPPPVDACFLFFCTP